MNQPVAYDLVIIDERFLKAQKNMSPVFAAYEIAEAPVAPKAHFLGAVITCARAIVAKTAKTAKKGVLVVIINGNSNNKDGNGKNKKRGKMSLLTNGGQKDGTQAPDRPG